MKRLMIAAALLLCSCNNPTGQKQPVPTPAFRLPTPTEAFDLQSKCTALGQKILEDNVIGSALTQEQVSRYDPTDNRCYVRLTVQTADLTTPRENYVKDNFLEDGQTGEILAVMYFKGQKGTAEIFDTSLGKMVKDPTLPTTDEVSRIMDKFVTPDRRP